jgi:hypothetical protein
MGGSSLCPEVFSRTFGIEPGFPELLVLDSTDPIQIKSFRDEIDLARTCFASRATVLGFGPRFLHSTGQVYKGGPNSGVLLQITCDESKDLHVPGDPFG